MLRKLTCLALALLLAAFLPLGAGAVTTSAEAEVYAHEMVQYYRYHGEDSWGHIEDLLKKMEEQTPNQARIWQDIMEGWSWANSRMPVYRDVLPDGLPQDDSMAIVVLGFGLNDNGSMKPELLDRLEVALASAEKYPNALLVLTGGPTADKSAKVSEAREMADFLKASGVAEERMVLEDASMSTTENARNTYFLLTEHYPNVDSLAIVTSDYHVPWASAMFTVMSRFESGYNDGKRLEVVGNAGCKTDNTSRGMYSQAWGVCLITGITFREDAQVPALSIPVPAHRLIATPQPQPTEEIREPQETLPAAAPEAVTEEPQKEERNYLPALLIPVLLAAIAWILMPKKPKKKRKRPEWKLD